MKHSHFQTPRTLDECQFSHAADPIERPIDRDDRIVLKGSVIVFVGLVAFYLLEIFA